MLLLIYKLFLLGFSSCQKHMNVSVMSWKQITKHVYRESYTINLNFNRAGGD